MQDVQQICMVNVLVEKVNNLIGEFDNDDEVNLNSGKK